MSAEADPLAELRRRFLVRAAEDLEQLRSAADLAEVQELVHRLSGAAGVFGFAALSEAARVVDDALMAAVAPPEGAREALVSSLEALPPAQ